MQKIKSAALQIGQDPTGLSVSDKPLFHASISYNVNGTLWDWSKLLSTDYSKMTVYDINEVCNSLERDGYYAGIIYMYTNVINGKRYIGQTIAPRNRNKSHNEINNKKKNHPFYNSMRKYGRDKFSYRVIGIVVTPTLEERRTRLDNLEREIIALYRTTEREYGYNILEGGYGCAGVNRNVRPILQFDLDGNLVEEHISIAAAERKCGFYIRGCLVKSHYAQGFIFIHEDEKNLLPDLISAHKQRKIYQYDYLGNLIAEFSNTKEAAKSVNGDKRKLTTTLWINNPNRTYAGYRWLYTKHESLPPLKSNA